MQKPLTKKLRWSPKKIEQWPIKKLRPAKRNANDHSPEQIEELRVSIRTYGFPKPILVRPNREIIAGHGRWEAAKLEGYETVPVIVVPPGTWTDAECRAYALADNQLGRNSVWNPELLRVEIAELAELSVDAKDMGFREDLLVELGNQFKSDGAKETPDTSAQLGDLIYQVIVGCRDEDHQRDLLARFEKEGLQCRALIS